MNISDLLAPTEIMIDVRAANKRALLQEFAGRAAGSLRLPAERVASYLLKREGLGSTGIGRGVAIPHARLPDLQRPRGLLAKLKPPIDFDAIDGQAVIWYSSCCCPRRRSRRRWQRSRWWRGRCGRRKRWRDCGLQRMPPSFMRRLPDGCWPELPFVATIISRATGRSSMARNIRRKLPPTSSAR